MKRHSKNSNVQSTAYGALWNLSALEANRAIIYRLSGINLIVSGMKMHVTVSSVQHKACLALANMAANATHRADIASVGGMKAAIDAMKCHVEDAHVQKYACKFLAAMLAGVSYKKEVATGASAVRVAMQYHDNKDFMKYAHQILAAVSFGVDDTNGAELPPAGTSIEV